MPHFLQFLHFVEALTQLFEHVLLLLGVQNFANDLLLDARNAFLELLSMVTPLLIVHIPCIVFSSEVAGLV